MTDLMQEAIRRNRAWFCQGCGKCSAVCPITRWEGRRYTSPRLLVEKAVEGWTQEVLDDPLFWSCLTCKRCSEMCPSEVHFSEFLRDARSLARDDGLAGDCTHGDIVQTWGRMMVRPELKQNRLGWLGDGLRVAERSDTLFFTGCLPYYDATFRPLGFEGVAVAQAAVKVLNRLGIEPVVLADERCCGHDQLWQGDLATFRALAELNLELFRTSGARRIVTTCAECARTLKLDYPQLIGPLGLEVHHIAELLAATPSLGETLGAGRVSVPKAAASPHRTVTYQDPCRLGRHLKVYDAPRQVLAQMGLDLVEMPQTRSTALCCGTSCWTSCGQVSKNIQVERLGEARATGAGLLVTACPKCQIHFRCAQEDAVLKDQIGIEVRDLITLVAEQMG